MKHRNEAATTRKSPAPRPSPARRVAFYGLLVALAMVFSYLEALVSFDFLLPGVKLGLANLILVFLLYTAPLPAAVSVSGLRVLLSFLLFGNPQRLAFSLAGWLLSLLCMLLLKRTKLTVVGVSTVGGVAHNMAQLTVAALLYGSPALFASLYLPILLLAGTLTGALIGVVGGMVIKGRDWEKLF